MEKTTEALQNEVDNANQLDDLHKILDTLPKNSFLVRIDEMRQAHNIKSFSSIQRMVTMSRTQFYDVLNGKAKPQKQHIIKIGLAMKLSVAEINELLKLARHKELYTKIPEDLILIYGIRKNMSIIDIEEELVKINASFSLLEK